MVFLSVTWTLARELVRAIASPFRLLAYLPKRRAWRRRATLALTQPPPNDLREDPLRPFFETASHRSAKQTPPHIFLSAGEASGEAHAARLVRSMQDDQNQATRWSFFGGQAMVDAANQHQGGSEQAAHEPLDHGLLWPLSEHAVMGIGGVLKSLPFIVRAFARFVRLLEEDPPDLVVLVDYPGLHLVMAKAARRRGVPVLHYVAPQYWAWGPWRMRRYRRSVDATLTILPFEVGFFRQAQLPSLYVGHPVLDELKRNPPDARDVAAIRERRTLVIMPGSRRKEIELNLPGMIRVAQGLRDRLREEAGEEGIHVLLVHRDEGRVPRIRELLAQHGGEDFIELRVGPIHAALAAAHVILAKSGTGSLEACLHGAPTVVVYKLKGWAGGFFYRNFLSVPCFAAANLVAKAWTGERDAVPEFCFRHDTGWAQVEDALHDLWIPGTKRATCIEDLAAVRRALGEAGATERVAEVMVRAISRDAAGN